MKYPHVRWWHLLIALAFVFLAGCKGNDGQPAAKAIEAYLAARVKSDVDQMTLLSCPTWEAQARLEAVSFQSMDAALDGVRCEVSGTDESGTLVTCQGKIVTTYQGESREWSVSDHPYRVVNDGGEWRMCGYGE